MVLNDFYLNRAIVHMILLSTVRMLKSSWVISLMLVEFDCRMKEFKESKNRLNVCEGISWFHRDGQILSGLYSRLIRVPLTVLTTEISFGTFRISQEGP